MIKLFTNREQIRLPNSKSTDLDWYYSKHFWKLKLLTIHDLYENPPDIYKHNILVTSIP